MRIVKLSVLFVLCCCVFVFSGCDETRDLRIRNETQQKQIAYLDSEVQAAKLQIDQLKRQLKEYLDAGGVENETLREKIAALEKGIHEKQELIAKMQQQLLFGGMMLPVELSTLLEDFANSVEMVSYDSNRGVVKFQNDLLFETGSDTVASNAIAAVKSLSELLNSAQALQFDIIIAGHTDDERIGKPETRAKHPTNWHLSAHRAISVLNLMAQNKVASERLSVRGFGEFRPAAPNKPNMKGNPQNRRVEIFIVSKGI